MYRWKRGLDEQGNRTAPTGSPMFISHSLEAAINRNKPTTALLGHRLDRPPGSGPLRPVRLHPTHKLTGRNVANPPLSGSARPVRATPLALYRHPWPAAKPWRAGEACLHHGGSESASSAASKCSAARAGVPPGHMQLDQGAAFLRRRKLTQLPGCLPNGGGHAQLAGLLGKTGSLTPRLGVTLSTQPIQQPAKCLCVIPCVSKHDMGERLLISRQLPLVQAAAPATPSPLASAPLPPTGVRAAKPFPRSDHCPTTHSATARTV